MVLVVATGVVVVVVVGGLAHCTGSVAGSEVPESFTATTLSEAALLEIVSDLLVKVQVLLVTVIVTEAPELQT